jgi:hypothetical protein
LLVAQTDFLVTLAFGGCDVGNWRMGKQHSNVVLEDHAARRILELLKYGCVEKALWGMGLQQIKPHSF